MGVLVRLSPKDLKIDPKWYEIAKMRILEIRRQKRDNSVINSGN